MCKPTIILMLLLLAITSVPGFAVGSDDLAKENAKLKQRVEQVELELLGLKRDLANQGTTISSQKKVSTKNR